MFDDFSFMYPGLLLLIPIVVGVWAYARLVRRRPAVVFSSTKGLASLPVGWRRILGATLIWLEPLALSALVVACARPRTVTSRTTIYGRGIAIMMCVDTSMSMAAEDFVDPDTSEPIPRIDVVKDVFKDFVEGDGKKLAGRDSDLIGLVSFGGYAESQCPLTLDHPALLEILKEVDTPKPVYVGRKMVNRDLLNEEQRTAIGDALMLSINRLEHVKAKSKIIILLSDGESNAGEADPEDAVKLAKEKGIRIYTIGVGKRGRNLSYFRWPMPDGSTAVERIVVGLDDSQLKQIAEETGAKYYNVEQTEQLADVYASIDKLEKVEIKDSYSVQYEEHYRLPLIVSLAMMAAAFTGLTFTGRYVP